jgi:hypothetical protein
MDYAQIAAPLRLAIRESVHAFHSARKYLMVHA